MFFFETADLNFAFSSFYITSFCFISNFASKTTGFIWIFFLLLNACFAFVPPSSDDSVSYSYSYGLRNNDVSGLSYCYAPLQLPHGATITNATFYFYDNDAGFFKFYLMWQNQTLWQIMKEVYTTPGSDTPEVTQISLDDTINGATVDNNNYYYYLLVKMPYSSTNEYYYRFYYALVEYAYP